MTAHVVALSGGKDSTAMALWLVENEPREYEFVCTPTGRELPEMFEHWMKLGGLLGRPLKPISDASLDGLIHGYGALPNWRQRWCTRQIKIEPFKRYLLTVAPAVSYVGLRADEAEREGAVYGDITGIEQRYPLRELGWGVGDVLAYLGQRGVTIPKRTDCDVCFLQRLGEWWDLWKDHPQQFAQGEEYEAVTGHTFRSPGRDSWPASLKDLRARFEAGDTPRDRRQLSLDVRPDMCRACTL